MRDWRMGRMVLRTFGVVLQHMQVAIAVRDENVQLASVREEFGRNYLQVLEVFAEESHSIGFLL
jgi:hypothetical protein